MDAELHREVLVPLDQVLNIENLMRFYGIKSATVVYNSSSTATIDFTDDSEYLVFVLRDILGKAKKESGMCLSQPDFDFMIRLEKKLKTYSKSDDYYIRKSFKKNERA